MKTFTKNNGKGKTNLFETAVETIASKDNMRPALQCAYISNGFIYVTNAHILIKQSLSLHGLEDAAEILDGKMIHKDVLKELKKCDLIEITDEGIKTIKGRVKASYEYEIEAGRYPDAEAVIPKNNEVDLYNIGINPQLLMDLTKVLINESDEIGVKLHFNGVNKGIVVKTRIPLTSQLGLIMPLYDEKL